MIPRSRKRRRAPEEPGVAEEPEGSEESEDPEESENPEESESPEESNEPAPPLKFAADVVDGDFVVFSGTATGEITLSTEEDGGGAAVFKRDGVASDPIALTRVQISTLDFGSENIAFNSRGYGGSVLLHASLNAGKDEPADWKINFGGGHDFLFIHPLGTQNYLGAGSVIAGAGGENFLLFSKGPSAGSSAYTDWVDIDAGLIPEYSDERPTIKEFPHLAVEAEDGEVYKSTLFGNEFDTLWLLGEAGKREAPKVTVKEGFELVTMVGKIDVDVSALREDGAVLLVGDSHDKAVKVADIDKVKTKPHPDDDEIPDIGIVLLAPLLGGTTISIENMTMSTTSTLWGESGMRDAIRIAGAQVNKDKGNRGKRGVVQRGERRCSGSPGRLVRRFRSRDRY